MDPETKKQFEEFDARLRLAEKRILATGNLVNKAGIPWLVDTQVKIDALMESHTRLYGDLQELTASQKELVASQKELAASQKELAASQKKTDENLNRLAATVQAFIDSMKIGGNGSKS